MATQALFPGTELDLPPEAAAMAAEAAPEATLEAAPAAPAGGDEAARLRAALEALSGTVEQLRAQANGAAVEASLVAENEALRAARSMDLEEMRAILAELEPMLEEA